MSVLSLCLHSIQRHNKKTIDPSSAQWIYLQTTVHIIDILCFTWFAFELLIRILVYHPNRKRFFAMLLNWVDIITVLTYIPQFIELAIQDHFSDYVEIIASLRLLRLLKFFRLSSGLEVLKHTMIASSKEIMLLLLMLMVPVTFFATIVYFCERQVSQSSLFAVSMGLKCKVFQYLEVNCLN